MESALISHATESDITGYKPSSKGMGAYFSTEETVTTMQLGDIPESEWFNDDMQMTMDAGGRSACMKGRGHVYTLPDL